MLPSANITRASMMRKLLILICTLCFILALINGTIQAVMLHNPLRVVMQEPHIDDVMRVDDAPDKVCAWYYLWQMSERVRLSLAQMRRVWPNITLVITSDHGDHFRDVGATKVIMEEFEMNLAAPRPPYNFTCMELLRRMRSATMVCPAGSWLFILEEDVRVMSSPLMPASDNIDVVHHINMPCCHAGAAFRLNALVPILQALNFSSSEGFVQSPWSDTCLGAVVEKAGLRARLWPHIRQYHGRGYWYFAALRWLGPRITDWVTMSKLVPAEHECWACMQRKKRQCGCYGYDRCICESAAASTCYRIQSCFAECASISHGWKATAEAFDCE